MLHNITWGQYVSLILILLVLYYGWYIYKYYGGKAKRFLNDPSIDEPLNPFERKSNIIRNDEKDLESKQNNAEELLNQLELLVNRIRTNVLELYGTDATKREILDGVAEVVKDFGGLNQEAYKVALHNYIIEHAIRICGVEISEEDLEKTWASLPRFR